MNERFLASRPGFNGAGAGRGKARNVPGWLRALAAMCVLAALFVLAACENQEARSPTLTPPATPPATASPSAAAPTPEAALPPGLTPATVTRVIDGDTIEVEIGGVEYTVRYIGVNTPETVDPRRPVECFGREASDFNKGLVLGKAVGLEKDVSETDDFGRLLRYVWVGEEMVNAVLVREGYAQASAYPPDVKYQAFFSQLQAEAREAGRGLWGAACVGTPTAPPAAVPGACEYSGTDEPVIKGNISMSTGEKIYHVPGGEFYDKTVIDETKGERWFCTEEEAIAAGWRKSKH